jgi:hypothetical protein
MSTKWIAGRYTFEYLMLGNYELRCSVGWEKGGYQGKFLDMTTPIVSNAQEAKRLIEEIARKTLTVALEKL